MPSRKQKPKPAAAVPKRRWLWTSLVSALVVIAVAGGIHLARRNSASPPRRFSTSIATTNDDAAVFATYGRSPSCKACHAEAYRLWESSHHALAERNVDPSLDAGAFQPGCEVRHGSQISYVGPEKFQITTASLEGPYKAFRAERVLGVDPLRQYLIPARGGCWQSSELAFDPRHSQWFDVYGEEDRRVGEWGHWTGRGMTWNTMCAACHNTRLRKNYQENTDSYATAMAEMSVSCEACHGPMASHNDWQAKHPNQAGDPTVRRIGRQEMFEACGSCHARRAELTGDFFPGEKFLDHYALTIPDHTDLFYPDGQVRDEDYEFTSFLGSGMHAAGVRCIDCHEPHSGKTRIEGNNLCMVCHAAPAPPAPKIDLATHSHHKPGERGDRCVDCHMPQTVYMQRHARHDHGFTIPDPLLTKELNIPNACNRCHTERTPDWSLEAMEKWYGPAKPRLQRIRAQTVARARRGDRNAVPDLLRMLRSETNSLWKAVSASLLRRWASEPSVTGALLSSAGDTDALVRAMSVRALEMLVQRGNIPVEATLSNRLNDPVRGVRIDAAWALRATLDTNSIAGADLLRYLRHSADQPAGALQLGVFHLDRGDTERALTYFERSVAWDTNSAPPRHALAVALGMQRRVEEAVRELEAACRLAPGEAEFRFKLGLALNEVGKVQEARAALEQAVKLDPQFTQAWYNLGLAQNQCGSSESALESLRRAEALDGRSPQIPYARATILARIGRIDEARIAASRALELEPAHGDAARLLQTLRR